MPRYSKPLHIDNGAVSIDAIGHYSEVLSLVAVEINGTLIPRWDVSRALDRLGANYERWQDDLPPEDAEEQDADAARQRAEATYKGGR